MLYQGLKEIPTEKRETLEKTLTVLDGFLSNSKWFAGNNITIADYAILGTITTVKVSSLKFSLNETTLHFLISQEFGYDLTKHQNLNDWYSRCERLPGFQENVEGAKYLAERMFAVMGRKYWAERNCWKSIKFSFSYENNSELASLSVRLNFVLATCCILTMACEFSVQFEEDPFQESKFDSVNSVEFFEKKMKPSRFKILKEEILSNSLKDFFLMNLLCSY